MKNMDIPVNRPLTPEEYIELRLDAQLVYFEKNSARYKRSYYLAQTFAVVGAASVPVLLNWAEAVPALKGVAGVTGAATAVVSSMLTLRKQQELWIKFRATAEQLQSEKFAYLTRTGVYAAEPPAPDAEKRAFQNLVARVEAILTNENTGWSKYIGQNAPATGQSK